MAQKSFIGLRVRADGWFEAVTQALPPSVVPAHPHDLRITVAFYGRDFTRAALDFRKLQPPPWTEVTLGAPIVLQAEGHRPCAVLPIQEDAVRVWVEEAQQQVGYVGRFKPNPHVTIGRARGQDDRLRDKLQRVAAPGPVTLDGLGLYLRTRRGLPRFEVLGEKP